MLVSLDFVFLKTLLPVKHQNFPREVADTYVPPHRNVVERNKLKELFQPWNNSGRSMHGKRPSRKPANQCRERANVAPNWRAHTNACGQAT